MHPESKFTKPRPDCPHPERWHAPDGQATEVEITALVAAMVQALQPELVYETGSHTGHSAQSIGKALRANGHGRLVTVELDPERARAARSRVRGLPVAVVEGDSLVVVPPGPVDFLWIDGLPSAERFAEWLHLGQYLSDRGVVMFHDTGPHKTFREQLDAAPDLELIHLPTPRGVSIGRRLPARLPRTPGEEAGSPHTTDGGAAL